MYCKHNFIFYKEFIIKSTLDKLIENCLKSISNFSGDLDNQKVIHYFKCEKYNKLKQFIIEK